MVISSLANVERHLHRTAASGRSLPIVLDGHPAAISAGAAAPLRALGSLSVAVLIVPRADAGTSVR